jgi:peptidoglycan/LPS O-acetylase OafA/YrhL
MSKSDNKTYQLFFPAVIINYQNAKTYIPALDGLRGIAILLVILFHTFHFTLGWCGVDLFFILSGFLITSSLIETKEDNNYLKKFWLKRVLRIFPLYYLILIIILIPKDFFNINTVSFSSWSYWFYVQNWVYVYNGLFPDGKDTLNHFWSLAIEEQFYFLFPFIIKYVPKKNLVSVLLLFIAVPIGARYYYFINNNIGYYVATVSRLDALSIGALLAYLVRENKHYLEKYVHLVFYSALGYIIVAILIYQDLHFSNPLIATLGLTAFALLFACVLIYSISNFKNNFLNAILNNKYLKFIGKIAYGLYVYHWILYVLIKPQLLEMLFNATQLLLVSKVIASSFIFLLALIISYLSYHYFEKRIMSLRKI